MNQPAAAEPGSSTDLNAPVAQAPVRRRRRERHVPLRAAELEATLLRTRHGDPEAWTDVARAFRLLRSLLAHEYRGAMEELKHAYDPFDPDVDFISRRHPGDSERNAWEDRFFERLDWFLERANFESLEREKIEAAVHATSDWGVNLNVDFNVFERLQVFARGDVVDRRARRKWTNFFRREVIDVPVYERLVIAFHLKPNRRLTGNVDTKNIFLKLFKDIPQSDIEMLLPGTSIRMTAIDQGKIIVPTLSGAVMTFWKLLQGILVVTVAFTWYGALALLGLISGFIGYGVRSFFSYLSMKNRYQLSLTRNLYYQNLDNNAGVLHRILDEAEEQDGCEAMLALDALWRACPRPDASAGLTARELGAECSRWLAEQYALDVAFETVDALEKLVRLQVVVRDGDRFRPLDPHAAATALDRRWDDIFHVR